MRYIKSIIGVVIFISGIPIANLCMADEAIEVVKSEGGLTVRDTSGANQKRSKLKIIFPLPIYWRRVPTGVP